MGMRFNAWTLGAALCACALSAAVAMPSTSAAAPSALSAARAALTAPAADAEAEVRRAMEETFERLRGGDFGALYDALPSASQRRVTRDRFVSALERTRDVFELERLEFEQVRVSGDLAVLDTVVYARLLQPVRGEGKVVARQYMVREGGRWRVTTGDRSTVGPLLAAHPRFARQYPPQQPRVYLLRDGRWVNVNSLVNSRRPRKN